MAVRALKNPFRGTGMPGLEAALEDLRVTSDPSPPQALFGKCPAGDVTPLVELDTLAVELGIGRLFVKDERGRMELGSFKALGAAHAIAKLAMERAPDTAASDPSVALADTTFVCASAGNHGLSVAAGARVFGARAVIYLAETVPEAFADLLREKDAQVVVEGADYEESMQAACQAADDNGWRLLSDSSWAGYLAPAHDVMEGYLIMAAEAGEQIDEPPTHIFLQAGVGGLAAACAVLARRLWGEVPMICVVEPEFAPALTASIEAGKPVVAPGPVSSMGRLDCKEPSLLALEALAREADVFLTVSEAEAEAAVAKLSRYGMASSPSGAAGFAGLSAGLSRGDDTAQGDALFNLSSTSKVLIYVSEGSV